MPNRFAFRQPCWPREQPRARCFCRSPMFSLLLLSIVAVALASGSPATPGPVAASARPELVLQSGHTYVPSVQTAVWWPQPPATAR